MDEIKKNAVKRSDDEKKQLLNRINRIIGQLNGVKNMITEDKDCDDVLIQLSAVLNSVKSMANIIIVDNMYTCMANNKEGKTEVVDETLMFMKRF